MHLGRRGAGSLREAVFWRTVWRSERPGFRGGDSVSRLHRGAGGSGAAGWSDGGQRWYESALWKGLWKAAGPPPWLRESAPRFAPRLNSALTVESVGRLWGGGWCCALMERLSRHWTYQVMLRFLNMYGFHLKN